MKLGPFATALSVLLVSQPISLIRAQCMSSRSATVANVNSFCGNGAVYQESWNLNWKTYQAANPSVILNSGSGQGQGVGYCQYQYYAQDTSSCAPGGNQCVSTPSNEPDQLPTVTNYDVSDDTNSTTFDFVTTSHQYEQGDVCANDDSHYMQGQDSTTDENYQFTESC